MTVVFISHRLSEVRAFCSRVTILRGGRHVATGDTSDYADADIISMIAGRSLIHSFPPRAAERHALGAEVLRAERIGTAGKLRDASFTLHRGEILGVAGLQGMGQLDLFLAAFGMADVTSRSFRGRRADECRSPPRAMRSTPGSASASSPRTARPKRCSSSSAAPTMPRCRSSSVSSASASSTLPRKKPPSRQVFRLVDVDRRALWTRVDAFSGGNQQKIAIAKWLLAESRILLVYDPTRGIDVGTKNELYLLLRAYAEAGGAVLFYSTEIPELVHLADRVMVFYAGRVAAEYSGAALTEENILAAALGAADDTAKVA